MLRSFFNIIIFLLAVLACGCSNNKQDTAENDIQAIAEEVMSGNYDIIESLSQDEHEQLVDILQENNYYPDINESDRMPISTLPWCGGYWGYYAYAETVEKKNSTSGLLYQIGPNCYMWAPDSNTSDALNSDCSTAANNDTDDFMVSFYFGAHDESASTLNSMLRWTSSNSWVRALVGSNTSGRMYEQTVGGTTDSYDFYMCLDDYYDPYLVTFLLRKY